MPWLVCPTWPKITLVADVSPALTLDVPAVCVRLPTLTGALKVCEPPQRDILPARLIAPPKVSEASPATTREAEPPPVAKRSLIVPL